MNKYKSVIFDLDGTIYHGDNVAHYAVEIVELLYSNYIDVFFFTNNSFKSANEIFEKLSRLGIRTVPDKICCSTSFAPFFLKKNGFNDLFVIGSKSLQNELLNEGLNIVDHDKCKAVLVGMDFDFSYVKITNGMRAILSGNIFIACNIDKNYDVGSSFNPGCGAMVGALVGSTGRVPDIIIGKPSTYMIEYILSKSGFSTKDVFIVGDSIETDIAIANKMNIDSALLTNNLQKGFSYKTISELNELIPILGL